MDAVLLALWRSLYQSTLDARSASQVVDGSRGSCHLGLNLQ
jgi:hypothetical protein